MIIIISLNYKTAYFPDQHIFQYIFHCKKMLAYFPNRLIIKTGIFSRFQGICLITVYMPCRGRSDSAAQVRDTLDEISELFEKFSPTHTLVILGDFNTSLSRDKPTTKDRLLHQFLTQYTLLPKKSTQGARRLVTITAKVSKAHTDYIFTHIEGAKIHIDEHSGMSTSDHTLVWATLLHDVSNRLQRKGTVPPPQIKFVCLFVCARV